MYFLPESISYSTRADAPLSAIFFGVIWHCAEHMKEVVDRGVEVF
ncbi:hypothetical protein HRbin04_00778 [archaeon HR04]|nr:hypothetical protein HRbin04_00778 [archaeon HR04]